MHGVSEVHLTRKKVGTQKNVMLISRIVPYNCDIFVWNWSKTMNI